MSEPFESSDPTLAQDREALREEGRGAEKGLLTTGEMARLTSSTLRTVRFYEEAGLLTPTTRTEGGHRLFTEDQLHRLQLILDLREAGFSLGSIRNLIALKTGCRTAAEASRAMRETLEQQIDGVQQKIAKLRRLREELTSMAAAISECHSCEDTCFPRGCQSCDVLNRPDLPRALRILWDT